MLAACLASSNGPGCSTTGIIVDGSMMFSSLAALQRSDTVLPVAPSNDAANWQLLGNTAPVALANSWTATLAAPAAVGDIASRKRSPASASSVTLFSSLSWDVAIPVYS